MFKSYASSILAMPETTQAITPGKQTKKKKMKAQSSGALISEHQTLTDEIQAETSNVESTGMINVGATTTELMLHKHRKPCGYEHDQILDHNANINAETAKKKSTGLDLVCSTGHTEVIYVLLQNGAAKEIEDIRQLTFEFRHTDDPSNNNANPNDDLFIAPWNAAINNPMLNNGAHYTLNAMDAAVVMNRVDHNEDTEMVSMCSQLWSIESTQDTINWTHISTQPLIRVKRKRTRRNEIIGAIKNSGCRHIRNTTSRIATSAT
eukprot:876002_1